MTQSDPNLLEDGLRYSFHMEGDEMVIQSSPMHLPDGSIVNEGGVWRLPRSHELFPEFFGRYQEQQKRVSVVLSKRLGRSVLLPDAAP